MWMCYIDQRDFDRRHRLKVAKEVGDRLTVLTGMMTVFDAGRLIEDDPPLLDVPKEEMKQFLQALVDMAWLEYRISAGQTQGAGAAQAAHLEDMRALVSNLTRAKLPGVDDA